MKKTIRKIAHFIGWSTTYHVSATYQQDSHMSTSILSMTVNIKPWLHQDNYIELVDYIKGECTRTVTKPVITSITKIGI